MVQNFVKISQENKHIIVKNAGGLRGLTGATGEPGPQGEPGRNGIDGHSATIAIGETTTLPAGSDASVVNTGTTYDAVFNFGIPKGDKGDKGDAGAGLMITGSVETYADLPDDLTEADAGKAYFVQADGKLYVWSGTQFPADGEGSQFEGPQGPQGVPGEKGEPGTPAPLPEGAKTVVNSTIAIEDAGTEGITELKIDGNTTQTTYTGKNLFNKASTNVLYGYFEGDRPSTSIVTGGTRNYVFWIPCSANTTYTISTTNMSANLMACQIGTSIDTPANGVAVVGLGNVPATASGLLKTITTDANANYFLVRLQSAPGTDGGDLYNALKDTLQIEANNQQTSYEPYVGGVASPSPDYPQNVNVVSGTQTITITDGGSQSQTKTVRLGSLELCKIGTYQDYIYKSGDDWFVHKATKKLDVSALTGWYYNSNTNFRTTTGVSDIKFPSSSDIVGDILCSDYSALSGNAAATSTYDYGIALGGAGYVSIRNKNLTSLPELTTYLANNQIYAYVVLATPTDTKITDADLVSDLDDLFGATLYLGTNNITVSGSPIPAILDLTYFTWYRGPAGATGATGAAGPAGADGYSPTATVTQTQTGATITITDKDGTTTANIYNGTSGTTDYADLTDVYYTDKTLTAVWDSVNGQYNITATSPIRTTAPVVGDKIRVQFDTAHSGSQVKIKVNSDSVLNCVTYPVYSATTSVASALQIVNTNRVYEFVKTQETGESAVWSCLDSHSQVGTNDIAAQAISTAAIADLAITAGKIDWSNISTSGKFEFGNYLIQYGFETLPPDTANTWRDATFPTPFGSQPTLIGSINTVAGSETNAIITPRISEASTTGFRWACTYSGGYTNNQRLSWIAIGTKPSNNAKGPSEPEEQSRGVEEEPSPVEEPADENQR